MRRSLRKTLNAHGIEGRVKHNEIMASLIDNILESPPSDTSTLIREKIKEYTLMVDEAFLK